MPYDAMFTKMLAFGTACEASLVILAQTTSTVTMSEGASLYKTAAQEGSPFFAVFVMGVLLAFRMWADWKNSMLERDAKLKEKEIEAKAKAAEAEAHARRAEADRVLGMGMQALSENLKHVVEVVKDIKTDVSNSNSETRERLDGLRETIARCPGTQHRPH